MHGSSFKHVVRGKHDGLGFCLFDCPDPTSTTDAGLGGILPTPTNSGNGILPTLPVSLSLPNPLSSPTPPTSTSTSSISTQSSISTTTTTSSSSTSSVSTSTTSSTTSTSTTSTSTSVQSSAPPPPPVKTSLIVTSSDGQAITITQTINVVSPTQSPAADAAGSTPSITPSAAATAVPSFLDNKPLAGSVIGIGSAIALVILVILVTTSFRKSRRSKLEREALTEQLPWPGAAVDDDTDSTPSEGKHAPMDNFAPAPAPGAVVMYPASAGYGAPPPQAFNPYQQPAMPNGYYGQQPHQWAPGPEYGGYAAQIPQAAYGQPEQSRMSHYSGAAYDGMDASPSAVRERQSAPRT